MIKNYFIFLTYVLPYNSVHKIAVRSMTKTYNDKSSTKIRITSGSAFSPIPILLIFCLKEERKKILKAK